MAATLALGAVWQPTEGGVEQLVGLKVGSEERSLSVGGSSPLLHFASTSAALMEFTLPKLTTLPVMAQVTSKYILKEDGSHVAPMAKGFSVHREAIRVSATGEEPTREPLDSAGKTLKKGDPGFDDCMMKAAQGAAAAGSAAK